MAAPTIVSVSTAFDGSAVASLVVNKPSGAVENDYLVAHFYKHQSGETLSGPVGWTELDQRDLGNSRHSIFVKLASGSEPSTYTFATTSSQRLGCGIIAIRDVDTSTPLNVSAITTGSGSVPVAPSVTTTVADTLLLLIAGAANNASRPFSPPTGTTEQWDFDNTRNASTLATKTQSAAGSTGPFTWSSASAADDWYQATLAIAAPDPNITEPVTPGTLNFTGQSIGQNFTQAVDPGTLEFRGQNVNPLFAQALPVAPGVLAWGGQNVAADLAQIVTPGVFVWTGQTVDGTLDIALEVAPGVLAFSGQDIAADLSQDVTPGVLEFIGQAVTYALAQPVSPNTILFIGQDVGQGLTEPVAPAVLEFIGQAVGYAFTHAVTPGVLEWQGQNVTTLLNINYALDVEPGTLAFTGQPVTLDIGLVVAPGTLLFTGQNIGHRFIEYVAPGALLWVGQEVEGIAVGAFETVAPDRRFISNVGAFMTRR